MGRTHQSVQKSITNIHMGQSYKWWYWIKRRLDSVTKINAETQRATVEIPVQAHSPLKSIIPLLCQKRLDVWAGPTKPVFTLFFSSIIWICRRAWTKNWSGCCPDLSPAKNLSAHQNEMLSKQNQQQQSVKHLKSYLV